MQLLDVDDDKANTEIWYCYYCKIIVTNGDVKLIDKTQDTQVVKRIFFGVSAYGSLKTKKISTELQSLKVSAAACGNVPSRECKNREFVWELKRDFKQCKATVSRTVRL